MNSLKILIILTIAAASRFVLAGNAELDALIQQRINEFKAEVAGVYYESPDGQIYAHDADVVLHAASTMKVPVMMEVFRQVEAGKLSLTQPVKVRNEFSSIVDGSKFSLTMEDDSDQDLYKEVGKELPLGALLERMINSSSNLATNLIIEIAGPDNVMALMKKIGAQGMTVLRGVEDNKAYDAGRNNTTSARALAVCLKAIANAGLFRDESRKQMYEILLSQKFKEIGDGIARVQPGLQVASKDGFITKIHHDAAIVRDDKGKDTILVILTRGVEDDTRGEELVRTLAADIWKRFHK